MLSLFRRVLVNFMILLTVLLQLFRWVQTGCSFKAWKYSILFDGWSERTLMVVAFSLGPLEFWWAEDPPTEKHGDRPYSNYYSSQVCVEWVFLTNRTFSISRKEVRERKGCLELVHSDICGPKKPSSNGGRRYLITFIDVFSRKTWFYFLQE